MSDSEQRWFEVIGSAEVALKVLARDRDEAVEQFWQNEVEIEMILAHPDSLQITSVEECDPNVEYEQVSSCKCACHEPEVMSRAT